MAITQERERGKLVRGWVGDELEGSCWIGGWIAKGIKKMKKRGHKIKRFDWIIGLVGPKILVKRHNLVGWITFQFSNII